MIFGRTDTLELVEIPDAAVEEGVPSEAYSREQFRDLPPGPPPFVPLVETEKPTFNQLTHRIEESLQWFEDRVERMWTTVVLSAVEAAGAAVAAGYLVQPEGFTLALHEPDRNSFTQFLALTQLGLDLGFITNSTMQLLADHTGQLHEVTTQRFREIMFYYGLYYKTAIWDVTRQS